MMITSLLSVLFATSTALGVFASPGSAAEVCRTVTISVETGRGEALIEGDYCRPRHGPACEVLVLTHGATYDRRYWRAPSGRRGIDPVRRLVAPGLAVFNYDRLGSGGSEHPPSTEVTVDLHAEVLHGVISELREGRIGGHPHARVISLGHSLGSIVAVTEAATYEDVDALVLTGFSHTPSDEAQARFAAVLQPAAFEPEFAELDAGYFTTLPGAREGLFYPPGAPAWYTAYDEATKGVVSIGELGGPALGDLSPQVTSPVLVVAGYQDPFACDEVACASPQALAEQERAFFVQSPQVDAMVLPRRGHALTGGGALDGWIHRLHGWLRTP